MIINTMIVISTLLLDVKVSFLIISVFSSAYLEPYVVPASLDQLLVPSEVVGNIRFSHPTLYVFPGGQGDAALFGINGFNMLGKSCLLHNLLVFYKLTLKIPLLGLIEYTIKHLLLLILFLNDTSEYNLDGLLLDHAKTIKI